MVSLFLLVVIALVVTAAAIRGSWRGARPTSSGESLLGPDAVTSSRPGPARDGRGRRPEGLAADLERWRAAGLVTDEQVHSILAFTAPPPRSATRPSRSGVIAEAVGYVGAILAVVGLGLIVARYWSDLHTPVRLAGGALVALGLVVAGALVPEDAPARRRLRWSLWLAGTAAVGLVTVVAVRAALAAPRPETVVLVTALAVGLASGLLWRGRTRPVQAATTLGALVTALGALSRLVGTPTAMAVGVWLGALALLALGIARRVPARPVAEVVGAISLYAGVVMFLNVSPGAGGLLSVAGALALLGVVASPRVHLGRAELALLTATGAVVLAQSAAPTLFYFDERAGLVTGGLVWLVGASAILLGATMPMRAPRLAQWAGAVATLGGAALVAGQYPSHAPIIGALTAVGLLVLGTRPGGLGESLIGALGLLVNVPWLIVRFFPGEVRAPLVTLITGALFVALALVLNHERIRGRGGSARHGRVRH